MPYPDRLLTAGEEVVERLRPHGKRLALPVLVLLVVAPAAGFVLGALASTELRIGVAVLALGVLGWFVLAPVLRWQATRIVLTNRRLLLAEGVLTRTSRDVPLDRIDDIATEHSLPGRLLGYGTLTVETAGEAGSLVLADLPHVDRLQAALYELVDGQDEDATPTDQLYDYEQDVGPRR